MASGNKYWQYQFLGTASQKQRDTKKQTIVRLSAGIYSMLTFYARILLVSRFIATAYLRVTNICGLPCQTINCNPLQAPYMHHFTREGCVETGSPASRYSCMSTSYIHAQPPCLALRFCGPCLACCRWLPESRIAEHLLGSI